MRDLGAMEPCPVSTKGKHCINALIPSDDEHDLTLWCSKCGAMRRVPATGSMLAGTPMDDWPANAIPLRADT